MSASEATKWQIVVPACTQLTFQLAFEPESSASFSFLLPLMLQVGRYAGTSEAPSHAPIVARNHTCVHGHYFHRVSRRMLA